MDSDTQKPSKKNDTLVRATWKSSVPTFLRTRNDVGMQENANENVKVNENVNENGHREREHEGSKESRTLSKHVERTVSLWFKRFSSTISSISSMKTRVRAPPLVTVTAVHPISTSTIPEDILREIFEWLAIMDESPKRDHSYRITQVCKLWRMIALSTPFLWTYICFAPEPSSYSSKRIYNTWNIMVSWAGALPMTVELDCTRKIHQDSYSFYPFPANNFNNIARVVIKLTDVRILSKIVTVMGKPESPSRGIDCLELVNASDGRPVTSLSLDLPGLSSIVAWLEPTSVVLHRMDLGLSTRSQESGLRAMKSVRELTLLGESTIFSMEFLFTWFPALKHFTGSTSQSIMLRGRGFHERLVTLEIALHDFLVPMELPRLQNLGITSCGWCRLDEAVEGFYQFLRTHPNIRTFKVLNRIWHPNFSYSSLSLAAPQLTHLTLRSWDTSNFSQSLVIPPPPPQPEQNYTLQQRSSSLFPNLRSLTFTIAKEKYEKDESRKDRYHSNGRTYSPCPSDFGQLLGQIVRNRVSRAEELGYTGFRTQAMRVPPFEHLQIQEGLPLCPQLDRLPYATLHTDNGIFREYTFSPR